MAEKTLVTMEDGTTQAFGAKQKMLKNTQVLEDGSIQTKLEFANGRILIFTMPTDMIPRFACHGADQKFGDVIAGIPEVDDCVLAVEDLAARLEKGEWSMKREGGFAGASVLQRAIVECYGKTPEQVKEFLSNKSQAEKVAMRRNPKLIPFIEKIEAEKATKGQNINTDELLSELD